MNIVQNVVEISNDEHGWIYSSNYSYDDDESCENQTQLVPTINSAFEDSQLRHNSHGYSVTG